jgi:hypothetical protein
LLLNLRLSRVKAVNHIVGQGFELGVQSVVAKMLKVPEAHKAGCHPRDHGGGLHGFSPHGLVRAGHAQRTGGGNAKSVHGFAAQKFPNARAQHSAAIAHAGIGREAGAFKLQLHARAGFTEQNRPAITQLPGPLAKLVAAVDAGQRLATRNQTVAGNGLQQFLGI